MSKEKIIELQIKYSLCKSLSDCIELLEQYAVFLEKAIIKLGVNTTNNIYYHEAILVSHMVFTRVHNLINTAKGINYSLADNHCSTITDATIIGGLVRNLYELIGMCQIVYFQPTTEDEKVIVYNLWKICGYKERQKLAAVVTSEENKAKVLMEQKLITELTNEIMATDLYKELMPKDKGKITTKLNDLDFKIAFINKTVKHINWREVTDYMGIDKKKFIEAYTNLSLNAHPSFVSVFQFNEMFVEDGGRSMSAFHIRKSQVLISVFIAKYIKLFPFLLEVFEQLPIEQQFCIDLHNRLFRGENLSISNNWKKLWD